LLWNLRRFPRRGVSFSELDDAKVNRFQVKVMFVSGMGFFTDAYDLFVIGLSSRS